MIILSFTILNNTRDQLHCSRTCNIRQVSYVEKNGGSTTVLTHAVRLAADNAEYLRIRMWLVSRADLIFVKCAFTLWVVACGLVGGEGSSSKIVTRCYRRRKFLPGRYVEASSTQRDHCYTKYTVSVTSNSL